MKNPAKRGALTGLSKIVDLQADSHGYAPTVASLQARKLTRLCGLSAAVAAVRAEHCFGVPEHWSVAR